jgi:hypothetical protein
MVDGIQYHCTKLFQPNLVTEGIDDRETTRSNMATMKPAYGKYKIRLTFLNAHSCSCFFLDNATSFLAQNQQQNQQQN